MSVKVTSFDLQRRLKPALLNWPEAPGELLKKYLRPRRRMPRHTSNPFDQPYWILLPAWLDTLYTKRRTSRGRDDTLLPDVLRAQYCLFLAFRIRDDLMDDAGTPRLLAGAADRLIGEAGSILSRHFGSRSSFWKTYRGSIVNTAAALKKLDRLQRSPRADLRRMLRQYSRTNSVFRIGSAALCRSHGRMADYRLIRRFSDHFSAGCQILDDLSDIAEDLGRRRWNYAASYILRRSPRARPGRGDDLTRIAGGLASGRAGAELLDQAARLIDRAFTALAPLRIPDAGRCRRVYLDSLVRLSRELPPAGMYRRVYGERESDRRRGSEIP